MTNNIHIGVFSGGFHHASFQPWLEYTKSLLILHMTFDLPDPKIKSTSIDMQTTLNFAIYCRFFM
jgi:hypothetical protein